MFGLSMFGRFLWETHRIGATDVNRNSMAASYYYVERTKSLYVCKTNVFSLV
jgi:hypothetical protein